MNTKITMAGNAIISGLIGIICLFGADNIVLSELGNRSALFELIVQLIGTLMLALAYLNWMSKGQIIGGIYNRPLIIANMAHWMSGAIILIKFVMKQTPDPLFVILMIIYSIFAILFIRLLFSSPIDN